MSQVFNHAYRHGLLQGNKKDNPVSLSRCPESSSYEAVVVEPERMIIILNELNAPTTQCEWMIALLHGATGLRPEETFGLQWQDVNWKNGQINIQRAWSKGGADGRQEREQHDASDYVPSPGCRTQALAWADSVPETIRLALPQHQGKGKNSTFCIDLQQVIFVPCCCESWSDPGGVQGKVGWHKYAPLAGYVPFGQ